ncbi:hypothetical protein ACFVRD_47310 [Streptomyces sp. NPDC057908]|uniref:hypothetical protein n=1 Tax=Streptomyces sp. NPDC057908 TaxID=3346276 RepID=UPI0036EE19BA
MTVFFEMPLAAVPLSPSEPVRRFTWRARQRHWPGLQYMVSTGQHHGFESLEEAVLLLALDSVTVGEVLPQPFRLSFEHVGGRSEHTPDFLAEPSCRTGDGGCSMSGPGSFVAGEMVVEVHRQNETGEAFLESVPERHRVADTRS